MDDDVEDSGSKIPADQAADLGQGGTFSILFQLRRTVCEDADLSVPVTDAVMKKEPESDGTYRLDFDALVAEARRISDSPKVEWRTESSVVELHPVQQPLPDARRTYDPFLDLEGNRGGSEGDQTSSAWPPTLRPWRFVRSVPFSKAF